MMYVNNVQKSQTFLLLFSKSRVLALQLLARVCELNEGHQQVNKCGSGKEISRL